jgi:phosphonate transport system permease protein
MEDLRILVSIKQRIKKGAFDTVLVVQYKRDPISKVKYIVWGIILLAITWWSAQGTSFSLIKLQAGAHGIADIVSRMLPPDFSIAPRMISPIIETVQISILGTMLAILLSIPFGLLAAINISPNLVVYQTSRLILNTLRAIPEVIFALIFVAAVGLGPFPGVLAIGVSSSGMLGKFLADYIENVDPGPLDALNATGANKIQVINYAILPQILPEFVSLALFRWEMNFRASTILGIVGAGGIGFELMTSMRLFKYQEMIVILMLILLVVTLVDTIASMIRNKII